MYTVESLNDDAKPNIYAVVGSTFACAASEEMATMASANAILNTFISYFSSIDIFKAVVPPKSKQVALFLKNRLSYLPK